MMEACLFIWGNTSLFEVIWCQVGITHCHSYGRVTQYLLQREDVTAIHHKMTSEGVPQDVSTSTLR